MSDKTADLTFWETQGYKYPGFGQTKTVPDGLGGTIGVTYNEIDYGDRSWAASPYNDTPLDNQEFLSGEIVEEFSLSSKVNSISSMMPRIAKIGSTNSYSVTLDFSNYKASAAQMQRSDGATSEDTYIALARFFSGKSSGYTTIKVTGQTLDGSTLTVENWKLYNSGTLPKGPWGAIHNARVFLDTATQTFSGRNASGTQELSPTPPTQGSQNGNDTALGLCQLPADQRYVSITLTVQQERIKGGAHPMDRHDIYVATDTSETPIPVEPPVVQPPTTTPPVVQPPVVQPPATPPVVQPPVVQPPATPPVVQPPVVQPPVTPPVVQPPVVQPPVIPQAPVYVYPVPVPVPVYVYPVPVYVYPTPGYPYPAPGNVTQQPTVPPTPYPSYYGPAGGAMPMPYPCIMMPCYPVLPAQPCCCPPPALPPAQHPVPNQPAAVNPEQPSVPTPPVQYA